MAAMTRARPTSAAIYLRLSQDRAGDSLGIARQEELCRRLAAEKGWKIAAAYVDRDISAYSGKRRPGYEQMCDDIKNKRLDAVIVVDQDRLTRTPRELEAFIDLADLCNIALATVSGDLDLGTSDGRFRARIMGTVARQESEKKSERIKRQRAQAAQLGSYQGGRRPFGYEPDGMTIRKSEAKLIREAARRVLTGESVRKVVIDFNDRGVPAASGGRWGVTSMKSMLVGPRLAGLRVHQGEVVGEANWPAILDRETHERLRRLLGDPRRNTRGRPASHLLAGLLRCSKCGATMHSSRRPDGSRRYMCPARPGGCGRTAIVAEPLEATITEAVLYRLDNPVVHRKVARPKKRQPAESVDLEAIERDLDDLAADLGEGRISRREWLAARAPLERRREDARRLLDLQADDPILQPFREGNVRKLWAKADTDGRRAVLRVLIENITIGPGVPGRKAFDPDRVDLLWRG
jgi:DNA invertase Pin-like site-specific DNA recombinase